jgi:hypothetical protein
LEIWSLLNTVSSYRSFIENFLAPTHGFGSATSSDDIMRSAAVLLLPRPAERMIGTLNPSDAVERRTTRKAANENCHMVRLVGPEAYCGLDADARGWVWRVGWGEDQRFFSIFSSFYFIYLLSFFFCYSQVNLFAACLGSYSSLRWMR